MGEGKRPQAVFVVFDSALADTTPEMLGLWATIPTASAETVVFDASAVTTAHAPLWRANLPADLPQAQLYLAEGEVKLRASQQALPVAEKRLRAFMEIHRATGQAFDVSAAEKSLPQPEAELSALLSEIQEGRPPVSFGLGEKLFGGWEQTSQQFQIFVERLRQFVAYYAWVETLVQEQRLGWTTISWIGDVDTVWQARLSPEQVRLHQRTLALALQSRDTLMQMFILSTQFASKLSILLSTPGGAVLALPAAWKFLNQVLAEFGEQP